MTCNGYSIIILEGTEPSEWRANESAAKGEEDEGRRVRRLHERDAGLALRMWTS